MWILNALAAGLDYSTHEWRIQVVRLLLGVSLALKAVIVFGHGGWNRFRDGSFERYRLVHSGSWCANIVIKAYRPVLVARLVAALGIVAGQSFIVCAIIAASGLAFELVYEFRFHPVFMLLVLVAVMTAGDVGVGANFTNTMSAANTWSQVLICVISIHLYLNSAWKKIRSRQFRSGRLLAQSIHVNIEVEHRIRYREFTYPRFVYRYLAGGDDEAVARWRVLSRAVIVLEVLLPIGLLIPATYLVSVAIGTAMHVVFTFLLPRRLVPFSIATVATYMAYQP